MDFSETEDKIKINGIILDRWEKSDSRSIYFADDFVVKVDTRPDLRRGKQTAKEIDFWETLPEEDKIYFAEILDYGRTPCGKYWLKQKRYEIPQTEVDPEVQEFVEVIAFKYNLLDIWDFNSEPDYCNWTVFEGTPKIYDFAY